MDIFDEAKIQKLKEKLIILYEHENNLKKILDIVKEDIRECVQELVNIKEVKLKFKNEGKL